MIVGIVGAGLSGLACASRLLAEKGYAVQVFEAEETIGGLAGYTILENRKVPKTYHHVLAKDKFLQEELNRFGIPITWRKISVGLYADSRIHPFNGPLDLMRFDPLPFWDRLRLGWSILRARYDDQLRDVPVKDWVCSKAGATVFDKFVDPLVATYFGSSEEVCAAYLASRWSSESKSVLNTLGHSEFPELIDRYVAEVNHPQSGIIQVDSPVREVLVEEDGIEIISDAGQKRFDAVVVTCPPPEASTILKGISSKIISCLKSIEYRALLCLALRFDRKISNYYWVNVLDMALPFVACFEHGNLNPNLNSGLVYAVAYVDVSSPLWLSSDEIVVEKFLDGLEAIFGTLPTVKAWSLFRNKYGTPVYKIGYRNIEVNPSPRLYFAGIYRAFPEIRSSGPAIRTGIETAQKIIHDLQGRKA